LNKVNRFLCKVCGHKLKDHKTITSPSGYKAKSCMTAKEVFKGFGIIVCGCNFERIPKLGSVTNE